MKPQELRLGNLIKDVGQNGEIYPVTELSETRICAGPMEIYPAGFQHEHFVPLTEDWLRRAGFKQQEDADDIEDTHWYELHGKNVSFVQGDKNGYVDVFILDFEDIRVRYVHQLQNLYFALTSEELTLKT